ncbi:MAG: hypothetical protein N4A44_00595 [Alphaproteobacteria bacterium]|jgi:hypothetical protein|nr:hypothetical protein [Alphaproteobacteria bacterium]
MPYNNNRRGPYKSNNRRRAKSKKGLIYKINENLIMKWSILLLVIFHFAMSAMFRAENLNQVFGLSAIAEFGVLSLRIFQSFLFIFLPLVLIKYFKVRKARISLSSIARKAICKRIGLAVLLGLAITLLSFFSPNNGGEFLVRRYVGIFAIHSIYVFLMISALTGIWKGFSFIFDAEKQQNRRRNNNGYNKNNRRPRRNYSKK